MSVKCLSKIAILKLNQEINDNLVTITHNGKVYEPLIDWDPSYRADISKHADFCLVALKCDDAEYLTIFHDGTRQPGRHRRSRENILSICFPEFQSIIKAEDLISSNKKQSTKIHDVTSKLYGVLRTAHLTENPHMSEQEFNNVTRLQPRLRGYQQKTVKWLTRQELKCQTLKWPYEKFTSTEGCDYYLNLLSLELSDVEPKNIDIPLGGILAEEMGLGKTVEIISLILLHPRNITSTKQDEGPKSKKLCMENTQEIRLQCVCNSMLLKNIEQCTNCFLYQHKKCVRSYIDFPCCDEGDYICPKCVEQEGILVPSAGTVIVSPNTIKLQWLSEINKHTNPALRVLLYEGVSKQKISPNELASYDIILTDYSVLRQEIHFTRANETHMNFRRARRNMRVNSPLILVDWWRVCLDEAQMESSMTNASMLVKQLPAINRWAVTGTPIQNSLDDLITLLDFIGLKDVLDTIVWQKLTTDFANERCENLIRILQKVMWRTSKADVESQLKIPPQSEQLHFIELNNLEKLFYSDEHADCLSAFYKRIKGHSDLKGVANKALNLILQPMLKLRQDCSMPVLCLKSMKTDNNVKKFLQPQELLDHMKTTNENECKNQLRSMASIYNGMAALNFLKEDYKAAIDYYDRVLGLAKKYTDPISVDSLLQIHALYNVIQAHRNITAKDTPIISEYEENFNRLEWKYLRPYATNLQAAEKASEQTQENLIKKDITKSCQVWQNVLQMFVKFDLTEQLLNKVNDEVFLLHSNTQYPSFRMTSTILLVLEIWYTKIIDVRKELSFDFQNLDFFIKNVRPRNYVTAKQWRPINTFVKNVYECHIRKKHNESEENKKKKLCSLCKINKRLQTYECLVFDKSIDERTSTAEGTWNPTMQETLIKSIFSAVKQNKQLSVLVKACESEIETIALLKTEYKELVKLWVEVEYTVKAYDELSMCKMRISLANDDEEKTNFSVYKHEIDDVLAESKLNFDSAQKEFVLKYARLKYILHLKEDTDPGACPICHAEAQIKYVVLECGHHLCFFCFRTMSEKTFKSIQLACSVCRHKQKYTNVYYVNRKLPIKDGIEVKGDYSSKIYNIVYKALNLKSEDENVKILIFSHWPEVLKVISDALNENGIRNILNRSPQCVEKFKNLKLGFTCLLMSLKKNSQGLNLVEANHVFLVEPVLNPGEELQAINRVHRIGQTKPTFVHRFVVKNTIEENIHNSVSKDKVNNPVELTIESIKKLFEMHSYND